jgi:hypothetical protein
MMVWWIWGIGALEHWAVGLGDWESRGKYDLD